jgi:hypothetical protein
MNETDITKDLIDWLLDEYPIVLSEFIDYYAKKKKGNDGAEI